MGGANSNSDFQRKETTVNRRFAARSLGTASLIKGVVLLLIIGVVVWGVFKFLPGMVAGRINNFEKFTIAVTGAKTYLLSVGSNGRDAVEVDLPNDLYIPKLAHGYGQYKISKIYAVGELDHRGGQVVKDTLSDFVGVPVDAYVTSSRDNRDAKAFFRSLDFIFRDQSDLNLWERITFARNFSSVRFDRIKRIDVLEVAQKTTLADGSTGLVVLPEQLDSLLSGTLNWDSLVNERVRVDVVNSTEVAGLGNRAARVLSNIGVSVVSVDSSDKSIKSCQVIANKDVQKSKTVMLIKSVFNCEIASGHTNNLWDAQIILGSDYADRFSK